MASVLVNYHIRSGLLPSQKSKRILIADKNSYMEEHYLYIRGDGIIVLTELKKYKKIFLE